MSYFHDFTYFKFFRRRLPLGVYDDSKSVNRGPEKIVLKHWVFDLDGTLVDSFGFYINILKTIFAGHGMTLQDEQLSNCFGQPAKTFLAAHLQEEHVNYAIEFVKQQSVEDSKNIKPFGGVLPLLQHLQSSNLKTIIWTNRDLSSTLDILHHSKIAEHIEQWITGSCVSHHKPDPAGLKKICELFNCEPADLIVVGDHDYDMIAAKKAGAYAVRAAWHTYDPPARCDLADKHFTSVAAFTDWAHTILNQEQSQ